MYDSISLSWEMILRHSVYLSDALSMSHERCINHNLFLARFSALQCKLYKFSQDSPSRLHATTQSRTIDAQASARAPPPVIFGLCKIWTWDYIFLDRISFAGVSLFTLVIAVDLFQPVVWQCNLALCRWSPSTWCGILRITLDDTVKLHAVFV